MAEIRLTEGFLKRHTDELETSQLRESRVIEFVDQLIDLSPEKRSPNKPTQRKKGVAASLRGRNGEVIAIDKRPKPKKTKHKPKSAVSSIKPNDSASIVKPKKRPALKDVTNVKQLKLVSTKGQISGIFKKGKRSISKKPSNAFNEKAFLDISSDASFKPSQEQPLEVEELNEDHFESYEHEDEGRPASLHNSLKQPIDHFCEPDEKQLQDKPPRCVSTWYDNAEPSLPSESSSSHNSPLVQKYVPVVGDFESGLGSFKFDSDSADSYRKPLILRAENTLTENQIEIPRSIWRPRKIC